MCQSWPLAHCLGHRAESYVAAMKQGLGVHRQLNEQKGPFPRKPTWQNGVLCDSIFYYIPSEHNSNDRHLVE